MNPRFFAALTGALVLGTGIAGVIASRRGGRKPARKNTGKNGRSEQFEEIAGVIPTNPLFNMVRIGIGATGLACALNETASVTFNRTVAVSYAGMAVLGSIPQTDTMFGLMPIYGANVALHAGVAAAELLTEGEFVSGIVDALGTRTADLRDTIIDRLPEAAGKFLGASDSQTAAV